MQVFGFLNINKKVFFVNTNSMNELIKFKFLISFLDSFRFGAFTDEFAEYYLDNMIAHAEDNLLECILTLKFMGITQNNKDIDEYIEIAKKYYEKAIADSPY